MLSEYLTELDINRALVGQGQILVNGEWLEASSGESSVISDPGNGHAVMSVAKAGPVEVELAVSAARESFDDGRWTDLSAQQRAAVLMKVAELMQSNSDELARLESLHTGMPLHQAKAMVNEAQNQFRYFAGLADKIHGRTMEVGHADMRFLGYTVREPVGVAALIVPWNAPLMAACQKIAPALAAGCSCILKPAEMTPLTALALGTILHEAGVPAGVVNVLPGSGSVIGSRLASHPLVDKISFTGSTEVGKSIVQAATGNLKKVSLELGGKSPVVVLPDADLSVAVEGIAMGIFWNSGQICTSGTRLIAHEDIYEELVQRIADFGNSLKIGYSTNPESNLGPLISGSHRESVDEFVQGALAEGARLVSGGRKVGTRGFYYEPTVLADVTVSMRVFREEVFGPVLAATAFQDVDEAITLANDSSYGLAGSVWTTDVAQAHKLARAIRGGRIGINVHRAGGVQMPVGGYRQSGWGRENGTEAIEEYTEVKSIVTSLSV